MTQNVTPILNKKDSNSSKKVHFISLGCPKNRVDSENMLGLCLNEGLQMVDSPEEADTIIVNTCSFIGEAKAESVEAVLDMAEIKKEGGQTLVMSGCMAQRYVDDLEESMPEVDHFIGTSDVERILEVVLTKEELAAKAVRAGLTQVKSKSSQSKKSLISLGSSGKAPRNMVSKDLDYVAKYDLPRQNSMPRFTAYMKIAEGCDNKCAFCIIPKLRGKQRSRKIEDLVKEAHALAKSGVKELIIIAQDLTGYGYDLKGEKKTRLSDLLAALSEVEGIQWIRNMYAYPRSLSPAYLEQLNSGKNILPYLDIPVQHGSDKMLKRMKRGKDQKGLDRLLLGVKEKIQNIVIRTTVIVGFPGETEEDYQKLIDFAESVKFQRLGAFKYSDEENTAAYDLDQKVEQSIIEERYDDLMERQRDIHAEHLEKMIGTIHEALVVGPSEEHELLVEGRLWSQAPDIDGITYLSSSRSLNAGDIVYVEITDSHDYDLVGEVLEENDPRIEKALPFNCRA